MQKQALLNALQNGKPLLADGGMGTYLHQQGINFDACFDHLNLIYPDMIKDIHRQYIDAGARMLYSNTFGAGRYKLEKHGLVDKLTEINAAGVRLLHELAAETGADFFIAGDVGPLGVRLEPFGRVSLVEANRVFKEQIKALYDAGVDLIVLETFSDLYEVREALSAAREIAPDMLLCASMTFTRDDLTLLGNSPARVASELHQAGADIIGANCSGGPNQLLRILQQMRQAVPDALYSIKPNAGWPEQMGGRILYAAGADYFQEYARAFWTNGVNIIGGCCGTTPAHIDALRRGMDIPREEITIQDVTSPAEEEELQHAASAPTQLARKLADKQFVIAVEMDPPRGLSLHKLIAGASLMVDAGVDVIDVADSPMARMRMSPWAVCDIIQKETKAETVLHFPTRGRNLLRVQGDLLAAHAIGVRNVFVVMGDPTAVGDYPDAMDNYDLVPTGLIKLIKQGFNAGLDHAGTQIGQPTNFLIGCALNIQNPNLAQEAKVLRKKINSGADFILTQPMFNVDDLRRFEAAYTETYGPISIPILAGLLPLASARHASFLQHEVPGIHIPDAIFGRIEKAGETSAHEGVKITVDLAQELKESAAGVYIMPAFSRYDYVAEIVETLRSSE